MKVAASLFLRWRSLAAPMALLSLSGCLATMQAGERSSDPQQAQCKMGLDLFERSRCSPTAPRNQSPEFVRYELSQYSACKDPQSQQRIAAFEASCVASFRSAGGQRQSDRRAIRQRFLHQVSSLLLDPQFGPAVDRYKDLQQQARPGRESEADTLMKQLSQLAQKHGVDPSYAKELELW